jgi:hypothetical protein
MTSSSSDMSGAIVLGIVGTAIGVVAIDYAFSDEGDSWVDKLFSKKEAHADLLAATPRGKAAPARRTARSAPRLQRPPLRQQYAQRPQQYAQSQQYAQPQQYAQSQQYAQPQPQQYAQQYAQQPLAPPTTITPAMVSEAARRINAVLGTNLQTDGILTSDLQQMILHVQQQFGLPATGFPDQATLVRLSKQLGTVVKPAATAATSASTSAVADIKNFISKTFGGPPSSSVTGADEGLRAAQRTLNDVLYSGRKVLNDDGIMGPATSGALKDFQRSHGLSVTGIFDSATHDALLKAGSTFFGKILGPLGSDAHKTGAYDGWGTFGIMPGSGEGETYAGAEMPWWAPISPALYGEELLIERALGRPLHPRFTW